MICTNDRIMHLFDDTGICRDCGHVDADAVQLGPMAEDASARAIRCAQMALKYDVPVCLSDGVKWAALATFLYAEQARRSSVHLNFTVTKRAKEPAA